MEELPQGVVTFLMTDIEGSTSLWEREAAAMPAAMKRHDDIIERAVGANRGSVVRPRGEGDSRFAVFVHPADAVVAIVDIQRGLGAEDWPTTTAISIRAAIHTGFTSFERGDYYGSAVNRTARIRSLGHGGQSLVSAATYEALKDSTLPDDVSLRDLGDHHLEGLTRSERVFQIDAPGLPDSFPPLQSASAAPTTPAGTLSVFLADDNLLVREGVKALIELEDDLTVVGVASDYDELIEGATAAQPQVIVTDIRMPPDFRREGIEAAKEVRKRHPGTGIVILSQYDDPEYAISLLSEGAAGYAYLLKDRVGQGDQLVRAIREVASGGSTLDPKIVEALTNPVRDEGELTPAEELLLNQLAEGKPIKAIAAAQQTTAADVDDQIEKLWMRLAEGLSAGSRGSLERIKALHRAIVDREEQGASLSRLLPGGIADEIRSGGKGIGETEDLEVTVLMSDIRAYSTIAETTDPSALAAQLNRHRAEMNRAILEHRGTVMQFVGDAVMAVFGAPQPMADHAACAVNAAVAMHEAQAAVNAEWEDEGLTPFGLGIGLSTGPVAAALLGSEERLEYTIVGDTVNLTQRLQQWAAPGETVLSESTWTALDERPEADDLEPETIEGRVAPIKAYRFPRRSPA